MPRSNTKTLKNAKNMHKKRGNNRRKNRVQTMISEMCPRNGGDARLKQDDAMARTAESAQDALAYYFSGALRARYNFTPRRTTASTRTV